VTVCFGPGTDGHCPWWKHAIRLESDGAIDTDEDTLVVLVSKDPLFWLKSMSKHYYEIKVPGGSQRTGLDALFGELEHEGRRYGDAVELWSAAMRSFLDGQLYPTSRCVLLRYEDFLFRFWDVMIHLSAFLPANCQRLKESPNSSRSKSHGREVRGRDEALRFYSSCKNRHGDFTAKHFKRLREICPKLLSELGYESIPRSNEDQLEPMTSASCSWVPELKPGDIVAAHFHCTSSCRSGDDVTTPAGHACSAGRAWARVSRLDESKDNTTIELLKEVPREWHAKNQDDWSVVEWPVERSRSLGLGLARSLEQTVPRHWIDLRLPCPTSSSAVSLPLTEEGYREAVSMRSTLKMADFISQVISDLEVHGFRAGRVLDRGGLLGFSRWFSGEANVQSLAQIRRELPDKEAEHWVTFAPPRPTRCLKATTG